MTRLHVVDLSGNENSPPVANAGADQTAEYAGSTTTVTLDGSGSSDDDGDALTYTWSENGATIATGVNPTVNLGYGEHTLSLVINDGTVDSDPDQVAIHIVDTTPPTLAFTEESTSLWPPNHKMVLVVSGISSEDLRDGAVIPDITVSSSEDANGKGDGNTEVDFEVAENGTGSFDVYVRAERSGKGNDGRVYTITVNATDQAGNTHATAETVEVAVAQNQSKKRGKVVVPGTANIEGLTGTALGDFSALDGPDSRTALTPLVNTFGLHQNVPNPFNPETVIGYALSEASDVQLVIYNLLGQQVRQLVNGSQSAGQYTVRWNGRDAAGYQVTSGVYIYRLVAGSQVEMRKMILLK